MVDQSVSTGALNSIESFTMHQSSNVPCIMISFYILVNRRCCQKEIGISKEFGSV